MISIINHFKTYNVGDTLTAPNLYYNIPDAVNIEVLESNKLLFDTNTIIGGGGMLFYDFLPRIVNQVKNEGKKAICWGIGHNTHDHTGPIEYPTWLRECDLVGLRDWGSPYEWVPCPSCLHSAFDLPQEITNEFGFYGHENVPMGLSMPVVTTRNDFSTVINYLASCETVITSSYHGAYWATLLGKKVVAYSFSSKFELFKHKPVLLNENDDWRKHFDQAVAYPEALVECREANNKFCDKVRNLLD